MKSIQYESESEFAKDIISYLARGGWDIYQEVQPHRHGCVADIVAVKGIAVWIIETKLTMNFSVIGQALGWRGRAHMISIATPWRKRADSDRDGIQYLLEPHGVGWLQSSQYQAEREIHQTVTPRFNRIREAASIRQYLQPEHKTFADAGTNKGGRFTPFQNTVRNAIKVITDYPGIYAKELIGKLSHHYASDRTAIACLVKWTEAGSIKGMNIRREGRFVRFYTDEQITKLVPIFVPETPSLL